MGCLGQVPFSQIPVKILCGFKLDQVLKELKIPTAGAHQQQRQVCPRGSKFALCNLANSKNFDVSEQQSHPEAMTADREGLLTYLPNNFLIMKCSKSPNLENNSNKNPTAGFVSRCSLEITNDFFAFRLTPWPFRG